VHGAVAAFVAALAGGAVAQQPRIAVTQQPPAVINEQPPTVIAQQPPAGVPGELPELPSIEELSATVERPLFVRTRRPPAEPEAAPAAETAAVAVPSEEAPADLTGIVSGPERTYAILTNRATKEVHHLRRGETIEDWSIQEIGTRYVVLRRGPGSLRLELFAEKERDGAGANQLANENMQQNMRPRFAPQQARQVRQQQIYQQQQQQQQLQMQRQRQQRARARGNRRPPRPQDDN
jgi:general secretion pathway protein N